MSEPNNGNREGHHQSSNLSFSGHERWRQRVADQLRNEDNAGEFASDTDHLERYEQYANLRSQSMSGAEAYEAAFPQASHQGGLDELDDFSEDGMFNMEPYSADLPEPISDSEDATEPPEPVPPPSRGFLDSLQHAVSLLYRDDVGRPWEVAEMHIQRHYPSREHRPFLINSAILSRWDRTADEAPWEEWSALLHLDTLTDVVSAVHPDAQGRQWVVTAMRPGLYNFGWEHIVPPILVILNTRSDQEAGERPLRVRPTQRPIARPLGDVTDVPLIPTGPRIPTANYMEPLVPCPDDASCGICLEGSSASDRLYTARSCRHPYHYVCIDEWANSGAENSNKCPFCRKVICAERREMRTDRTAPTDTRHILRAENWQIEEFPPGEEPPRGYTGYQPFTRLPGDPRELDEDMSGEDYLVDEAGNLRLDASGNPLPVRLLFEYVCDQTGNPILDSSGNRIPFRS